jgi:hypothetical protein
MSVSPSVYSSISEASGIGQYCETDRINWGFLLIQSRGWLPSPFNFAQNRLRFLSPPVHLQLYTVIASLLNKTTWYLAFIEFRNVMASYFNTGLNLKLNSVSSFIPISSSEYNFYFIRNSMLTSRALRKLL